MTVGELINILTELPQDMKVCVTTEDACGYDDAEEISVVDHRATHPNFEPFVLIQGA